MKGIKKAWKKIQDPCSYRENYNPEPYDMIETPRIVIGVTGKVYVFVYKETYEIMMNRYLGIDVTDEMEFELGENRNKWTFKNFKACCEWFLDCIKEDEK